MSIGFKEVEQVHVPVRTIRLMMLDIECSDRACVLKILLLLAVQTMSDNRGMEYMKGRRIMELNPDSPVIFSLRSQFESAPAGPAAAATAELLYETALLTSGFDVESPRDFAGR